MSRISLTGIAGILLLSSFLGVSTVNAQISTEQFCEALNMTAADCALISSVSTSENHPWEITSENAFEGTALRSASSIRNTIRTISDLTATLSGPVAGVEFYRQVSSEYQDNWLIFTYNNIPARIEAFPFLSPSLDSYQNLPFFGASSRLLRGGDISGSFLVHPNPQSSCNTGIFSAGNYLFASDSEMFMSESEVQFGPNGEYSLLRLLPANATRINELEWKFLNNQRRHDCGATGMIDRLQLHPALTTVPELCSALDLEGAQCSLLQSLTLPSSQYWIIDDGQNLGAMGGSALRVPFQVTARRSSCLIVNTALPADRWTFSFRWRPDSATANQLSFRVNNSVLGTLPGNPAGSWTTASYSITTQQPITSLAWCHSAATGSVLSYGWIDQLNFASGYPQLLQTSMPERADDESPWVFTVQVRAPAGQTALPALELAITATSNVTVSVEILNQSATVIDYRITAALLNETQSGSISIGLSGESIREFPPQEQLQIEIVSDRIIAGIISLVGGLTDDADAAATISPGDLLLGLHLVGENGADGRVLAANLPVALDLMSARTALMNSLVNPQQRAVLDIDRNDTVDHLDFRLMLRYRAGLRGAALCDELCHNRLELLLSQ